MKKGVTYIKSRFNTEHTFGLITYFFGMDKDRNILRSHNHKNHNIFSKLLKIRYHVSCVSMCRIHTYIFQFVYNMCKVKYTICK